MILINPFSVASLLLFVVCFILILIIFIYRRNFLHRIWLLLNLSICLWGFGAFLISQSISNDIALLRWRVTEVSVSFIVAFSVHVAHIICDVKDRKLVYFVYLQSILFSFASLFSSLFFKDAKLVFNSIYYAVPGELFYIFFFIWISLAAYSLFLLYITYLKSHKNNKNQMLYLFLGTFIGLSGGITNFFPHFFDSRIYPIGNFTIVIYCIIITYAILVHQLMDINVAIRKGLVYSILVAIFTVIYLVMVILAERLFQGFLGYKSIILSIIFASIIALIFIPLKNKIQSFIDRIFLGKTLEQIAQENELLRQELMRSEKLKAVAQFASGMAHEIKNPLTALKTFAEYSFNKKEDDDLLKKFSGIAVQEVDKIDNLVHQLLDFSKPAPLQLKEANIHRVIDDTLDFLSSQFIKYHIKVEKSYALEAERYLLNIDSNQMKQVFLNLFLNSIDAMIKGGTLIIKTNLNSHGGNEFVQISISDSGCGILKDELVHIFEPFYSAKEKGTGLGLSIVQGIILNHKGKIDCHSQVNVGTTFIIELPLG